VTYRNYDRFEVIIKLGYPVKTEIFASIVYYL